MFDVFCDIEDGGVKNTTAERLGFALAADSERLSVS